MRKLESVVFVLSSLLLVLLIPVSTADVRCDQLTGGCRSGIPCCTREAARLPVIGMVLFAGAMMETQIYRSTYIYEMRMVFYGKEATVTHGQGRLITLMTTLRVWALGIDADIKL
ncbi:MAG: hypothetical protein QXG69_02355 [Candidatus Caldarchaeum sp.]|uniref:Uncharacterized protein n=1 Tax=Caldiarchaeum subterraneum TaxID=311458 RepID=A0A7C5Q8T0_CALS0